MNSANIQASPLSSHSLRPRPAWWRWSRQVVAQMRASQCDQVRLQRAAKNGDDTALAHLFDLEEYGRCADRTPSRAKAPAILDEIRAPHLPPEVWSAIKTEGGDPYATDDAGQSRAVPALPLPDLLLAMRLVATFRSEALLLKTVTPGAVTILTGISPNRNLAQLLNEAFFQGDIIAHETLPTPIDAEMLYVPRRALSESVLEGRMAAGAPLLQTVETVTELPELFSSPREGVVICDYAPLNRDILHAVLCASHSATGRIDDQAFFEGVPKDAALSGLSDAEVLFALRAPTARAVAGRLAALVRSEKQEPQVTKGPRIEITGTTRAHDAVRGICADLKRLREGAGVPEDMPRGLLVHGAPGCGKTHLARQMAGAAEVPLIEASFAAWQSHGHLGHMLKAMKESFDEAIGNAPAILFIDEIDAAGSRFSSDQHGRTYHRQVVNAFLQQIDRLVQMPGVILVGACNDIGQLDPAITRPGRFDEIVEMPLPSVEDILAILRQHLKDAVKAEELPRIAHEATGLTPAAIDAGLRRAKSKARQMSVPVSGDLIRACLGLAETDMSLLQRIAIHEIGHAITARLLIGRPVIRIAIFPRGGCTERAFKISHQTRAEFEDELTILLAGRAAEALLLGEISGGAGGGPDSDLALATRLAVQIDNEFGLGASGPVCFGPTNMQALSDAERQRARARLEKAECRAKSLLRPHIQLINNLAEVLVFERELKGDALEGWFASICARGPS